MLLFSAETPIEEFTPTPAFPALQYLESVDVEGVAWRAGLRTGDFLIEVIRGQLSTSSSVSVYVLKTVGHRKQHLCENYAIQPYIRICTVTLLSLCTFR